MKKHVVFFIKYRFPKSVINFELWQALGHNNVKPEKPHTPTHPLLNPHEYHYLTLLSSHANTVFLSWFNLLTTGL